MGLNAASIGAATVDPEAAGVDAVGGEAAVVGVVAVRMDAAADTVGRGTKLVFT